MESTPNTSPLNVWQAFSMNKICIFISFCWTLCCSLASGNNNNLISFSFFLKNIKSNLLYRQVAGMPPHWIEKMQMSFLESWLFFFYLSWKFTCKQLSEFRADTVRPKMDKILSYRLVMNRPSIDAAEPETIQSVWVREVMFFFFVYNFHNPPVFNLKIYLACLKFHTINSNNSKCLRKKLQEANHFSFCFKVPLAVGYHDRSTRCDRQCCWKILFCAVVLAKKQVPVSRAASFLRNEGKLSKYLYIYSLYSGNNFVNA